MTPTDRVIRVAFNMVNAFFHVFGRIAKAVHQHAAADRAVQLLRVSFAFKSLY
jgi:hypothetical protein